MGGFIGGFAPKPKAPALPPLPPAPTQKNSAAEITAAKDKERKRLAAQQGRTSTILTGGQGVQGDDSSGLSTKKLLGG